MKKLCIFFIAIFMCLLCFSQDEQVNNGQKWVDKNLNLTQFLEYVNWSKAFDLSISKKEENGMLVLVMQTLFGLSIIVFTYAIVVKKAFLYTHIFFIIACVAGVIGTYMSYLDVVSVIANMMAAPNREDIVHSATLAVVPLIVGVCNLGINMVFILIECGFGKKD